MPGFKNLEEYQQRLSHLERDLANVMEDNRRLNTRIEEARWLLFHYADDGVDPKEWIKRSDDWMKGTS